MKKLKYILGIFLLLAVINACTDDFEEINTDPNTIYEAELDDVFLGTVKRTLDFYGKYNYEKILNFSRYVSIQYSQNVGEDRGDDAYRRVYVEIIRDLELLDDKYADNEGFANRRAIIKTYKSFVYYMLASMYGPIPMSDAIVKGTEVKRNYKYDSELEIYTNILEQLAIADTLYNAETLYETDILERDPIYGEQEDKDKKWQSDITKWQKFNNTFRLHVAMHAQNLSRELALEHATAAMADENKFISSLDDMFVMSWGTNTEGAASPYFTRLLTGSSTFNKSTFPGLGEYFATYMFSYEDPRIEAYALPMNAKNPAEPKFLYADTLTRVHICTNTNDYKCPFYEQHQADGLNQYRRDSILVEYTMKWVPLPELNPLAQGWRWAIIPNSTNNTTFGELLNTRAPENVSYVPNDFLKEDASWVAFNWADALFLKAEAKILFGLGEKSAQEYYEDGIRASFAQYGLSAKVDEYMARDGIKWDTDGQGYHDWRLLYKADIKGHGGDENHLEQIYKQRYFADYFNGLEGWNLERRTRVLRFPPWFANGASGAIEGANPRYNYYTERFKYPDAERSKNNAELQKGIALLRSESPYFQEYDGGNNVFTTLGFAKRNPDLDRASELYDTSKEVVTNCEYYNKKYGTTYDEVVRTALIMAGYDPDGLTGRPLQAATTASLEAIAYRQRSVLGIYFDPDMELPEPEEPEEPEE